MSDIAFTNHKKHAVHIGGKTISPGQTRAVDETLVEGYKAPQAEAAQVENPLMALLAGNVGSINEALGGLSDDQLDALKTLEDSSEAPRKGVLSGILKETMARASELADSHTDADDSAEPATGADLSG